MSAEDLRRSSVPLVGGLFWSSLEGDLEMAFTAGEITAAAAAAAALPDGDNALFDSALVVSLRPCEAPIAWSVTSSWQK